MESGSLLPYLNLDEQTVDSTGLKIIVYLQSINWLIDNPFLQNSSTLFHKPSVTAIRIIDCIVNQTVPYWIHMNIVQPGKI